MTRSQEKFTKYLFITPAMLAIMLLIIYPILYGFSISLFDTNLMQKWNFIGLRNFSRIFMGDEFLKSIGVTLKFTIIMVVGHFSLGMLFAVLLNKNIKGRVVFRSILMIPWLFPEIVLGMVWKWILNPNYGIVNYVLLAAGIIREPISWLGSVNFAFPSLCFVAIWKGFPFVMLMILAALQSIPEELYEAGEIDGCVSFNTFRYITLPQLVPVLLVALILNTVSWFKHFNLVSILTFGGPANSTMLVSNYIYNAAFLDFRYGEAAAMSVVVFIICFAFGCLYRRILKKQD